MLENLQALSMGVLAGLNNLLTSLDTSRASVNTNIQDSRVRSCPSIAALQVSAKCIPGTGTHPVGHLPADPG